MRLVPDSALASVFFVILLGIIVVLVPEIIR